MKISLRQLKKIIRETTHDSSAWMKNMPAAPSSFNEFRSAVGNALKRHGAPKEFVAEVLNFDYEGGGVASALYDAWANISAELKRGDFEWFEEGINIYDGVQNAIDGYMNKQNYGPGHKAAQMDSSALATKVANDLTGENESF